MMEFEQPLSDAGERRREEILRLALRQARQRRQRPRFVACAIATLAALSIVIALHERPNQLAIQPHNAIPTVFDLPHSSEVAVEHFETDPTISARLALTPIARNWQQINDDELLDSLANAGQPAGIVQMDGQAILLTSTLAQPETR